VLYFLYFTQLYAEATTSGHGPILIPSVLFLLCCSPSLDREVQSNPHPSPSPSPSPSPKPKPKPEPEPEPEA
jgi:hypothetical protein